MHLLGFSLDNLSLMALTISSGFVVDDAIVVLESISRYLERGMPRMEAAIRGANEVGFTVLSVSLSLIAVFAPLIFFGGIIGRLFNEFALTLSAAVMISLAVSLTTTPMMCALILPRERGARDGWLSRATENAFHAMLRFYQRTLRVALRHSGVVMLTLVATIGFNYYMFRYQMTYELFPVQDTGLVMGGIVADQSISFQLMKAKFEQLLAIVQNDPAVESVVGFTGGGEDERWLRLCLAKILCGAQGYCQRRRGPTSRENTSRRRPPIYVRRLRSADRWPAEQRALPVHPALRRLDGTL
jgi:multidrug efflux pump